MPGRDTSVPRAAEPGLGVGLTGLSVLITGAASGIGAACARLAATAGPAALVLTDRDAGGLARTAATLPPDGPHITTLTADLADRDAPARIAAAAIAAAGRIDGLVNAAGLTDRGSVATGTLDLWDRLMAVNARAPFALMQAAIRDMTGRAAPGAIVNILSVNAYCGHPDLGLYSAAKGALATLTRNAAHAHLAQGIRVNGIMLGWTETEAEHRMQTQGNGAGPDWARTAGAMMPLGRLLQPGEVARHVLWLLSTASAPLTGVLLDLDQHVQGAP